MIRTSKFTRRSVLKGAALMGSAAICAPAVHAQEVRRLMNDAHALATAWFLEQALAKSG